MQIIGPVEGQGGDGPRRFLFEEELLAVGTGKDHSFTEVEVKVQTRFVGEFDLGHFRFGIWDLGNLAGERALCFRGASLHYSKGDHIKASKDGFYHGITPLEELAALFSLHFSSSFEVGQVVRSDDRPRRWSFQRADQKIEVAGRNLEGALTTINLAANLVGDMKLPFMLGLKFHSLALRQWKTEPEMAFISFVSAIEAVAQSYGREEEIGFDSNLEGLLSRIADADLQANLRRTLWQRGAVKRKVLAFIEDHTTDDFWNDPSRPIGEFLRVQPEDFKGLMKRVYDARSAFLHTGAPPPPVFKQTVLGAEVDPSLGAQHGDKKWDREEYLPHLSFIARLVQHLLITFLKRHQDGGINVS